eukprot:CAMPEP_0118638362 /NCGR_PEP_ID=MMETSP0785-20121206/3640_1 /TAXON_ID=91992 /ORGANISM="Bolidomonas pacifica, Strain CCMP 1866" /LENGTH=347 /DNA_ID=CAMNT_0006529599 /DNA_START=34 /DNA_END=1075 /DNA_ORIENTATION=-
MPSCAVCSKSATSKCSICKAVYYCSRDCQRKDYKGHKRTCKKVPSLPPTKVLQSPSRGRHLVATRPLCCGTDVLRDEPLVPPVLNRDKRSSLCSSCFCPNNSMTPYCSEACRFLNPYSTVEDRIIQHLKDPPSNVILATRILLACQDNSDYVPDPDRYAILVQMVASGFNSLGLCSGGKIAGQTLDFIHNLFCRINQNSFTVADAEIQPLGVGMYGLASTVNHACVPNTVSSFIINRGRFPVITMRTISDVNVGVEITNSYIDVISDKSTRMSSLLADYNFTCTCPLCSSKEDPSTTTMYRSLKAARELGSQCIDDADYTRALSVLRTTPEMLESLLPRNFPVVGIE